MKPTKSKSSGKILVTTSSFSQYGPEPIALLKKAGYEFVLNPYGRRLTTEELAAQIPGTVGLIAATDRLDESVFRLAPELKAISRVGTGLDSIDLEAAKKRGIQVLRTADAPIDAVAELSLGLMLNVLRRIGVADRALRGGEWKSHMGHLLREKTVGIVGLGRVGRRLVELLAPFKVKVIAVEPFPDRAFVRKNKIRLVKLAKLLGEADIVSLHSSLDTGTRGLLGAEQLKQMKPTAILINTARGELVDDQALATALREKRLQGAGIDVFNPEPYHGSLVECSNAVLTCHMGTYAEETRNLMEIQAAENLLRALRHK